MNTDEVRARFEKSFPPRDKKGNYQQRVGYERQWQGYQQATKDNDAEIERLRDEVVGLRAAADSLYMDVISTQEG